MKSNASIDQVWKSGFSFFTVTLAIAFTSILCFGIAFYTMPPGAGSLGFFDMMYHVALFTTIGFFIPIGSYPGGYYPAIIIASLFALIGVFILFFGYIGLIRKTMTDGITLGLENGKSHSNSKSISPMDFRETISAGADLFVVIIAIILIPTLIFFMGNYAGSIFAEPELGFAIQMIFQVSAVVLLLSGLLGISVKMVGDSIAHAVTKTGYGALVPQRIEADQVIFVDDIAPKFTKVEIVTNYEAPTVPLLPETGLPEGWTQGQWKDFGQQYLDGTL